MINGLPAQWLFLDFDGVVHANFPRRDRTDEQNLRWAFLPALVAVLRRHPVVKIVIASTWRRDHSLEALREMFPRDVAARIVSVTPQLRQPHGYGARQAEVEAWLVANDQRDALWVALDDVAEIYRPGACVVVANDGFMEDESQALDEALADPVAYAQRFPVPAPGGFVKLWVPGR